MEQFSQSLPSKTVDNEEHRYLSRNRQPPNYLGYDNEHDDCVDYVDYCYMLDALGVMKMRLVAMMLRNGNKLWTLK